MPSSPLPAAWAQGSMPRPVRGPWSRELQVLPLFDGAFFRSKVSSAALASQPLHQHFHGPRNTTGTRHRIARSLPAHGVSATPITPGAGRTVGTWRLPGLGAPGQGRTELEVAGLSLAWRPSSDRPTIDHSNSVLFHTDQEHSRYLINVE